MFSASWDTPYKGEIKTLRFHKNPIRHGLGHYTDVDGVQWDVYAIKHDGKQNYINARRIDQHQGYSDYNTGPSTWPTGTASGGNGHGEMIHTWIPYYVEVVDENGKSGNRKQRRAK
ncbi:hypothetical protein N9917_00600 [Deltaproteobacteria bacterium]|nr:hypothetical protein [Deltaproteobacteria bacterium]